MREVQTMVCKVDDASMRAPFWRSKKQSRDLTFVSAARGNRKAAMNAASM
jgi:hypothetical protein